MFSEPDGVVAQLLCKLKLSHVTIKRRNALALVGHLTKAERAPLHRRPPHIWFRIEVLFRQPEVQLLD